MKKTSYIIVMLLGMILFCNSVEAAKLKVTASTKNVVVGNTVNVTVEIDRAGKNKEDIADGWEYCLKYNSAVFTYKGTKSLCVLGSELAGNSKVTFPFKAKSSGSGTFSLGSVAVLNPMGQSVSSVTKGSVTVTARTQAEIEASYSDNDNLKNLEVEGFEITPKFDKNTTEYELEVENNVTSVNIIATKAESHASVSGSGTVELTEGVNKIVIVVTAQKGNQKKYTININRKELDPINVSVAGDAYTVVRKAEALEIPTYYELGTANIDGEEVPALVSDVTDYVLVGLKDDDGNIKLYKYLENKTSGDMFERYYQFNTEVLSFVPVSTKEKITGYENTKKIKIGDEEIEVYYTEDDENFVLMYGMNMASEETGWYQYDVKENTFQRYNDVGLSDLKNKNFIYLITICVGGGVLVLSLLVMLLLGISNSKMKKKNKKMLAMLEELNNRVKNIAQEDEEKAKKVKKTK